MSIHKQIDKFVHLPSLETATTQAEAEAAWQFAYPNTADFNFNYYRLLDLAKESGIGRAANPKLRIAVIGGGIAALTAARELFRSGFTNVHIFEATDRLGGRNYSIPVEEQHTTYEMGAMRIPYFPTDAKGSPTDTRNSVVAFYDKDYGVTTQPFPDPGSNVAVTGIFLNDGFGPKPFEARARKMIVWSGGGAPPDPTLAAIYKLWSDFAGMVTKESAKVYATPQWETFWRNLVSYYWELNFRELVFLDRIEKYDPNKPGFFGGLGMTEEQANLFYTIGAGDGGWGAFYDVSCLYPIRTLLFGFGTEHQLIQGLFDATSGEFRGGPHYGKPVVDSDGVGFQSPTYLGVQSFSECHFFQPVTSTQVPRMSLYDATRSPEYGAALFMRTSIRRIEKKEDTMEVEAVGPGGTFRRTYDAVILSPTTWATQLSIEFTGFAFKTEWPFQVQRTLAMSHWIRSCKVFYRLKKRYWEGGSRIPQLIALDTPLQGVYGYAVDTKAYHDPGVLLVSYTWEDDANKFLSWNDEELGRWMLDQLDDTLLKCTNINESIRPYVDESKPVVIHWSLMPTYHGCAKLYRERTWDDDYSLLRYNQDFSAKSGIYFAGEGFSVEGGWTEPALRGGLDAVIHLLHNSGSAFVPGFQFSDYPRYSTWSPNGGARTRIAAAT